MNTKQTKRARTAELDVIDSSFQPQVGPVCQTDGREQLLLTSPLQSRLGKKFCGETELLPLLIAQGLVRRVHIAEVEIRPLGGDSFKIVLDSTKRSVGEVKSEIARTQGTPAYRQDLYKVAIRMDGVVVREDDADPEPLEDRNMVLQDGDVVAMAVKDELVWRIFPRKRVRLSENGAQVEAKKRKNAKRASMCLITTGVELTGGQNYWEVEVSPGKRWDPNMYGNVRPHDVYVGVSRPNLKRKKNYAKGKHDKGWFIRIGNGSLYGNGKDADDQAGGYHVGDRVGVLLSLEDGSLRFFKNGVQHGPGYPAGSVTGPVVHALQVHNERTTTRQRLLPNPDWPESTPVS
jgi:hypothetical protein